MPLRRYVEQLSLPVVGSLVPARGGRAASTIRCIDRELLERITARRAELDALEEQLAEQLVELRAERDELAVAEKVLERVSEQLAGERASAAPTPGRMDGQAVMLIPHRRPGVEEGALPTDYQRILAAV
uniref:Uncharacterized protein n=1 Tax=Streptomyces sp. NBC_00003 TaxID=2903608 RepID=A0AAU2UXI2_9ACTN